jgi:tetratricopeptide (TPR) repeat protein
MLVTMASSAAKSLESQVWDLLAQKNIKQAIARCEQLNQQYPEFASGWHTASQIALKLENFPMALAAVERALSIIPDNTDWLLQKAVCLSKLGRAEQLGALIDDLSEYKLDTAYQCSTLGMLLTQLGLNEQALVHYERATQLESDDARHFYNLACLQRTLGNNEAAESNFDKTVSLDPTNYEAFKIRSELRKQTPENNHVELLESLLGEGIDDQRGKIHVCYALAKELEDLNEPERSFHYLQTGSKTRRSLMQYDVERDLQTIGSIRKSFTHDVFDRHDEGFDNKEAVFILGMPRTGTTLVERILSSHSDVFAAGELNNFAVQMMQKVKAQVGRAKPNRDDLVRLTTELDFERLGEAYVDSTRPFTGHSARFIDKMPLNYLYVGLIHLALPNAKIINLKRHPLDTCYAVYKQLFVDAYPFSYDLEELGRYYVAYHQLMEHWHAVLPGVVHTVEYEALVTGIEQEARRLTDFCELDWQPQCLRFYENKAASTTASTVQVRQPVYRSSVGRWQDYREELAPLISVLQDADIPLDE